MATYSRILAVRCIQSSPGCYGTHSQILILSNVTKIKRLCAHYLETQGLLPALCDECLSLYYSTTLGIEKYPCKIGHSLCVSKKPLMLTGNGTMFSNRLHHLRLQEFFDTLHILYHNNVYSLLTISRRKSASEI